MSRSLQGVLRQWRVLRQLKYVFSGASLNSFRFFDEIHRLRGPNLRCISNMCTNDSSIVALFWHFLRIVSFSLHCPSLLRRGFSSWLWLRLVLRWNTSGDLVGYRNLYMHLFLPRQVRWIQTPRSLSWLECSRCMSPIVYEVLIGFRLRDMAWTLHLAGLNARSVEVGHCIKLFKSFCRWMLSVWHEMHLIILVSAKVVEDIASGKSLTYSKNHTGSSIASPTILSRYANISVFIDCENNQFLKKLIM
jgi:hypothetical protein